MIETTLYIEFKRCGIKYRKHKKKNNKYFELDKKQAFELEIIFIYILLYKGSLLEDVKSKYK
jgi:hypothetical protein